MIRRLHVAHISAGTIELSEQQSHHARDVLRLKPGTEVELFDDAGRCATGSIEQFTRDKVSVRITQIEPETTPARYLTIASAIPKGERADWMIEKLSELGVSRFVPLITERSVVHASGKHKLDRWRRVATESAKQSRRVGVMQIDEPANLIDALDALAPAFVLSTAGDAQPISKVRLGSAISLFVGPEGGWSDAELASFAEKKIASVKLTDTILRVETAAIVATAAVIIREPA